MPDQPGAALLDMTVGIVAHYVARNRIDPEGLPGLIAATHAALANAGAPPPEPQAMIDRPTAAQVRRSVSDAGLVSFLDGKTYQSLKRHLTGRGFTPETYREPFGLRPDYPMVIPANPTAALAKARAPGQGDEDPHQAAGRGT